MKQNILFRLFTLGLTALFLFTTNCAKSSEQSNKAVIAHLNEYLNSRMQGGQYTIDPKNAIVKPLGKNRYHIILKNSTFFTDLTETANVLSKLLSSTDNPYSDMDSNCMEEVSLDYGPAEDYIKLHCIKGFSVGGDIQKNHGTNKAPLFGGFNPDKIRITIGKITFRYPEGYDSGSSETMEHFKIQVSGMTSRKDKISILLDIEKIGKVDVGKEDDNISSYFLDQNANPPNLQTALETGTAINDLTVQLGKVNISIKKNGNNLCDGTIENASYLQYMKPDNTGKAFKFGHGIKLNNLKMSIPGENKIQLLSRVKEFDYEFSIKNLSPSAALAFLDLLRISFISRNQVDSAGMNEYTSMVTKLIFEIMNSKTYMVFKIKPFRHYFGEMEATLDIKLYHLMAGPIVTLKVKLFKTDAILNKLKEAGILTVDTLKVISDAIDKYAVNRENGDTTIIYEMDIQELRNMYFKGNQPTPPTTQFQQP
jgi:hypothetical protein